MVDVLKMCAIAFVCVCASVILEHMRSGTSFGIKIAGCLAIFGITFVLFNGSLRETVGLFESALGETGMKYIGIIVKALGIAYVSGICASLCRDIGETTAAEGIEAGGKVSIITLSLPIISEMLEGAIGLLETV